MTELGLPALNFGAWWGMWGPPGLPADLDQTHQRLGSTRRSKDLAAKAASPRSASSPTPRRPQFFAKFIADDLDRSAKLLKAANFQPE